MVTRTLLILSLLLLGAFDAPGIERARVGYFAMAGNACNACRMHEEIRALSLKAIKDQILSKLGLKQAPNMTGRALPRIPPISKLMDMYGMQADQPQPVEPGITHHDEVDEYAAKTESVFALAQPREYPIAIAVLSLSLFFSTKDFSFILLLAFDRIIRASIWNKLKKKLFDR